MRAMKVIGAGFGRTGTLSLKAALDELGFGPCYHMIEVFQHPDHDALWQAAGMHKPVDWDALFAGYASAVDWPACNFYAELMEKYPAAKLILTRRDPERWYESVANTIRQPALRPRVTEADRAHGAMIDTVIWQGTFGGRFEDKAHALEVYRRHNDAVVARVPPERLLQFEVKQGWEPLCRFLGVPVPADKPFPHLNDTASFQARRAARSDSDGDQNADPR